MAKKTPKQTTPEAAASKAVSLATTSRMTYGIGFLLLAVFCCWTYGDVFRHIALDDFVCSDAEAMTYVRRQSMGSLYWGARYVLLVFKNQWLGGILMAALLTLTAWLFDRCVSRRVVAFCGLGFLPVVCLLSWMVYRGYNLFFRCDVSTFVIWTLALFLVALIVGAVGWLVNHGKQAVVSGGRLARCPVAAIVALLLYGGLTWQAIVPGENVRVSCRMQNLQEEQEWQAMAEAARTCTQPSRSVAAYYVIALVQQNQLLERVFDIPYNYPDIELDDVGGNDEGVNYIADCNFYAGIPNAAYHTSMENLVMEGPRLRAFKRMVKCSIISGEDALARRYLNLISKVPFEQAFVEKYSAYVGHPDVYSKDPEFANVIALYPREQRFEQNYRQPVFLGYNVGLLSGTDQTLVTSVATCMYSKDLNNLLVRTNFLQQKISLPLVVQQSIAIASLNREGLLDNYPQVKANGMLMTELTRFINDSRPFLDRQREAADDKAKDAVRKEMAEALRADWLGSYYYYYYCGNIDQTVKKTESHGVN